MLVTVRVWLPRSELGEAPPAVEIPEADNYRRSKTDGTLLLLRYEDESDEKGHVVGRFEPGQWVGALTLEDVE